MDNPTKYIPNLKLIPKDFHGKLPVVEIFQSFQGEGRWCGFPAVFIRLDYCDFGCAWCDTRYTWDPLKSDKEDLWSFGQIKTNIEKLSKNLLSTNNPPHIVLTGGEPLLHQDRIPQLIYLLRNTGFNFFQVETHSAIAPNDEMLDSVDWWNCSPKLSNSLLPIEKRVNRAAIMSFLTNNKVDFKFVVRRLSDIQEIKQTYGDIIPSNNIWIMPESTHSSDQLQVLRQIAPEALKQGYRLSIRLHVLLWNNQRGK